eukprot:9368140-Pyramimonas_sp.AAC.2
MGRGHEGVVLVREHLRRAEGEPLRSPRGERKESPLDHPKGDSVNPTSHLLIHTIKLMYIN